VTAGVDEIVLAFSTDAWARSKRSTAFFVALEFEYPSYR